MDTNKILYFIFAAILAVGIGILESKMQLLGVGVILALVFTLVIFPIILKNPLNGLIIMAFCLPFEYIPSLELSGVTFKLNHLVGGLTVLSWLIWFVRGKIKISLKFNPVVLAVIFFLLTQLLSLTGAVSLGRPAQVMIFLIFTTVVFLLLSSLVQTKEDLTRILKAMLWGAILAGAFAIFQFFGDLIGLPSAITGLKEGYSKITFGFPRVQSFLPEPLYFASYLFLPLFIIGCFYLAGTGQKILGRRWQIILVLTLAILLILTVSRGAYLGFLVGLILVLIFNLPFFLKFQTLFAIILTVFFASFGVWLALSFSESRALDEFLSHAKVEDLQYGESTVSRLKAIESAYEAWRDHPLLGIGLGNYGPYMENYPPAPPETGWVIVNNQYLETLCETGIVGLGGLVLFLTSLLWRSVLAYWRAREVFLKAASLGLLLATVAVLVQYNTFSTIYILPIWFLFGLSNTASTLVLERRGTDYKSITNSTNIRSDGSSSEESPRRPSGYGS